MRRALLLAALAGLSAFPPRPARAATGESCEAQLAATRNFRNGAPAGVVPLPDGSGAVYLRSGPRDTVQALYRFDAATRHETVLARPADLLGGAAEHLTVEERARRERARISTTGFAGFVLSKDGREIVTTLGGVLWAIDVAAHAPPRRLAGAGWLTPHLAADGRSVAAVRDDDLHVIDLATGADRALTTGGTETVTHGLAEFAAAEELDRLDGFWWSPDGKRLLVEEADMRGVETHWIADPGHPERAPVAFRYPRAGTANAKVSLRIVPRDGGADVAVQWNEDAFPYLARVVWPAHGALSLVVLDRSQTEERVLAVDPATGATRTLLAEHDPAWIDLAPFSREDGDLALPHWLADGTGFLWASDRSGEWQLELRHADGTLDHAVTPAGFRFSALHDVAGDAAIVTGGPDPTAEMVYAVKLAGGAPRLVVPGRGLHTPRFGEGHALFADHERLADGTDRTTLRRGADGSIAATLPSVAETPRPLPRLEWAAAGPARFDAVVVRPHAMRPGAHLPVVLSVYGGPGFKVVRADARAFLPEQCLADRGAIVVSLDGRGTPGHGRDFERATKFDLIDKPMDDQIAGLRALAAARREMDMRRVAVEGWSFGGTFAAMATMRHPELFRAGVAGAPVTDWRLYDTAYTERYLGTPELHPDVYRANSVVSHADRLARPLLIVHGLTDDNVYFANTFELTQALLRAGRPYRLLLLPGTHMLADPVLRAAEAEATDRFLAETVGLGR